VTFVGSTTAGWSCSNVGQVVTCIHAGVLPLGAATPLIIDVAVAPGVTTAVSSSLELSSSTPDPVTPSTATTGSVTVLTSADLSMTATHIAPVVAGSPLDYTVSV
jgi:large repetitive protein